MKLAAEHEYGIYAKTVKNNDSISEEDKKYIHIAHQRCPATPGPATARAGR